MEKQLRPQLLTVADAAAEVGDADAEDGDGGSCTGSRGRASPAGRTARRDDDQTAASHRQASGHLVVRLEQSFRSVFV